MTRAGVNFSDNIDKKLGELEDEGHTPVCLAVDNEFVGLFALSDRPKEEAELVIKQMQSLGIDVWMFTGDNIRTATVVASKLGITNVMGDMLPKDKMEQVKQLQKQGKIVAMVGDGINDSPALTQSDVGFAVAAGTDIAIEAASVVLMKSDLKDVLVALHLSRRVFRHIQLNFTWAFFYNLLGIPIAAGILYPANGAYIPPAFAGLSEILSSVPVVLFPLFLHLYKPPSLSME